MSDVKTCERNEELIGFLYGELSELEARRFQRHLNECTVCETELAAFGQIRQSIVEWRDQTVGLTPLPAAAVESSVILQPQRSGRSAIAALREFFALSPVWLKGVTAFASVLFCICAVLAVSYLKNPTAGKIARINNQPMYTEAQLKAEVSKAVSDAEAKTRAEMLAQQKEASTKEEVTTPKIPAAARRSKRPGEDLAGSSRRPFTTQERQELAADLRLVSSKDEDELDFSSDANRPTP